MASYKLEGVDSGNPNVLWVAVLIPIDSLVKAGRTDQLVGLSVTDIEDGCRVYRQRVNVSTSEQRDAALKSAMELHAAVMADEHATPEAKEQAVLVLDAAQNDGSIPIDSQRKMQAALSEYVDDYESKLLKEAPPEGPYSAIAHMFGKTYEAQKK